MVSRYWQSHARVLTFAERSLAIDPYIIVLRLRNGTLNWRKFKKFVKVWELSLHRRIVLSPSYMFDCWKECQNGLTRQNS